MLRSISLYVSYEKKVSHFLSYVNEQEILFLIYKGGDRNIFSNYRLISLSELYRTLCAICLSFTELYLIIVEYIL